MSRVVCLAVVALSLFRAAQGYGQVGPAEITDPQLRSAEQSYLTRMVELNRAVGRIRFPFTFALSRYAGLDPKQQIGADARGLEFVHFHGKVVLKLTGNYNAAYSADLLTANQRASRVFDDVVIPILRLLPDYFSPADKFGFFGLEIAYHIRTHGRGFDYEGKEILVVVMNQVDALSFAQQNDAARSQEVLNRSEVYLNGNVFGLALGARDPLDAEALAQSVRAHTASSAPVPSSPQPVSRDPATARDERQQPASLQERAGQPPKAPSPVAVEERSGSAPPALHPDPDMMQKKYQTQLDELAAEGLAKHHFVDYSPPSFVVFRDQIALQFTLKNPYVFDGEGTSIYRRAARSFDLFLAPQLKPILDKVPRSNELGSLDVTVINELSSKTGQSSEALEFVLPIKALNRFIDYAITNQDLIDQSIVLVNGVRIALNLQLVE
jgi:hypothetical protein